MSEADAQFERDLATALALSKQTAELEEKNRHSVKWQHSKPIHTSAETNYQSQRTTNVPVKPPPPCPEQRKSYDPFDISQNKDTTPQVDSFLSSSSVRARPRPKGRAVSPSFSTRRSGYAESTATPPRTESPNESPRVENQFSKTSTSSPYAGQTDLLKDPWGSLDGLTQKLHDSKSVSSKPNDPFLDVAQPEKRLSASFDDLLKVGESKPRADSVTDPLIVLSPMNNANLTKHYNLDLDNLFAAQAAQSRSAVQSVRENIPATRPPFDVNQFFGEVLNEPAVTSRGKPSTNPFQSTTYMQQPWLPMPTTTAPSTPPAQALLPKPSNASSTKRTSAVHLKRVSTPTSDLLDFSDDRPKLPQPSSLHDFDPLVSPSDSKIAFEQKVTDFKEQLSNRARIVVAEDGLVDDGDADGEAVLQDPFSYEDLSMALMTASKIKGRDVEEEVVEEAIYEEITTDVEVAQNASTPPRPFKPRSLSVSSDVPKSLKVSGRDTMDEFTAFSVMVARLKAEYTCDDSYTNLGILFSPTVNLPKAESFTVHITVDTNMIREPVVFTVDINTLVEIVIWTVMSNISADMLELDVDDYILKVFGRSEYLINDSRLSDYAYVHNCLKQDEPIRFSLHDTASIDKPFLRQSGDDEEPIYMIKDELHGDLSYKMQPRDLQILLDTYKKHAEKVQIAVLEKGLRRLDIKGFLQSIKAITSVLLGSETVEVLNAVKSFKIVLHDAEHKICSNVEFGEMMDDFQKALEAIETGVKSVITMYCETFHVRFSPADDLKHREVREVTDSAENVLVGVSSVHRIPAKYRSRFDQFRVIASLYYAGSKVTDHVSSQVISIAEDRGYEHIYFDEWLQLTDRPMCTLPIEARLMFTLCAMNTLVAPSGSGTNEQQKWINIGWVSMMLFDFKRNVSQGGRLLPLWSGMPNSTGATSCNIWQPKAILLQINLPDFGFDLRFPKSLISSPKRPDTRLHKPLPPEDAAELEKILMKSDRSLNKDDKEFLWDRRKLITDETTALTKVLQSAPSYDYPGIHLIQEVLDIWADLPPLAAMKLLLPNFPCLQIRDAAVRWLKAMSSDEMCDYLPQLVQCLKSENYHDSPLARFLLERSITSVRLAQQLYWALKEAAGQPAYRERYKLLFGGLVSVMGKSLREEVEMEERLVKQCDALAQSIKDAKGDKDKVMQRELLHVCDLMKNKTIRLPTNPSEEVIGLDFKLCTYFNSFTLPLKLVFKNVEAHTRNRYIMYKVGDDLRQDMLVMQLIRFMDKLWQKNGLDLKIVTFTCLPTGDKRGMVELITEAETLGKIHTMSGITGSFKDQPLANWLQKHNPTNLDYCKAGENFTLSCAGYCVATYILGVGDRHNDNIMVKKSGHIFHIDFSKFMGDAQMFGSIKRDRTPFVLTPDMAYVINGGDKPSQKFQDFIDLCSEAFNILRENSAHLITLIKIMTSSGIHGMTSHAIDYVRTALLLEQSNSEATASFTRMIEESLKSRFVQLNFFIHNLAQLKFLSHSDGGLLSFIPTTYSMATDGRITNIEIFDYQKRYTPEKHYIYIIKVHRENEREANLVYRRYSEFQEFHQKLISLFPLANLPKLPGSILLGRTHVQKVAEKRKAELELFLRELLTQTREVSEHDLIYTFFHPMLRDETEVTPPAASTTFKDTVDVLANVRKITGEVKLMIVYKEHCLHIMVMHVKGLVNETGDRPNPYVKLYLLPDPIKTTKRKTKIVRSTFHPTYNEMFKYKQSLGDIRQRTLQVTIWSADMTGNEFLGAVHLSLHDTDLSKEWTAWHKLTALHRVSI